MTNPVLHEQTGMITRWIMGFGHEVTSKSKAPWLSRLAMISQYFSSSSTPMAFRPRFRAATRVEPLPANGSAITPGGHLLISSSISDVGFILGCIRPFDAHVTTVCPERTEVVLFPWN